MKRLRRVTEAEVIAEFLKNEFYQEEFHEDREQFEQLVLGAQITDEAGNALRRALLFRRRGHMWRELPEDTQWWEVQIEPQDLERVRVFPRAQWRRVANGSFLLKDIVRRIKTKPFRGRTRDFIAKVQALSYHLRNHDDNSAVLLIGVDDEKPVTVLEGNHRLTAASAGVAGGIARSLSRVLRIVARYVAVVLVPDQSSEPVAICAKSHAQSVLRPRCRCGDG